MNLLLYTSLQTQGHRPPGNFVRDAILLSVDVARQMLDTSYISYESSATSLLTQKELAPSLIGEMQQKHFLPASRDEIKSSERAFTEQRRVTTVRFDRVMSDPVADERGFLPVDIRGVAASNASTGASEKFFHYRFFVGSQRPAGQPEDEFGRLVPIVADFQELPL